MCIVFMMFVLEHVGLCLRDEGGDRGFGLEGRRSGARGWMGQEGGRLGWRERAGVGLGTAAGELGPLFVVTGSCVGVGSTQRGLRTSFASIDR